MIMWRKNIFCYISSFAGGCYTLALSQSIISQYENVAKEEYSSEDDLSSIILPDDTRYNFHEDIVLDQSPLFFSKTPLYWQLFMLTKSRKRSVRHKAIAYLSELNNLKKWESMMISQACGSLTAVALARSPKLNQSFFFSPPFRITEEDNLCKEFLDFIVLLPQQDVDPSIQVCFEKAKKIGLRLQKRDTMNVEIENFLEIYHCEQKKRDLLEFNKLCLQVLLYHSTIESQRLHMIKNGILKLFWKVLLQTDDTTVLKSLIARILANFALEEQFKNVLYVTGFVGILATWARCSSLNVSLPSAKALANLDVDDYHHSYFDDDIYLLHPTIRCSEKHFIADVIFVHGLFGGTFWTWRQSDTMQKSGVNDMYLNELEISEPLISHSYDDQAYTFCWPKDWLAVDFPNLRVLSVDYNTIDTKWKYLDSLENEKENFCNKSKLIMSKLIKARVGEKPIIWVTHSMGGILIKQLLLEAAASEDLKANSIAQRTSGIIFFGVPHKGSEFATLLQSVPNIFQPSVDFSQLHKGSLLLLSLHNDFLKLVEKNSIAILSFGESKKSKWGLNVVSKESSNPGVGEFYVLPVDHLSICKPESQNSQVYIKFKEFLKIVIPTSIYSSKVYSVFELSNIMCLIS